MNIRDTLTIHSLKNLVGMMTAWPLLIKSTIGVVNVTLIDYERDSMGSLVTL